MKEEIKDQLPLSTRLTCLKSSFKMRKTEKWTDKELLDGFDILINQSKSLEHQNKELMEQLRDKEK